MPNVNERLASLEKQTEENGKTIWRVFESIYGNGKPGLITEFRALKQSVEAHHQAVEKLQNNTSAKIQWFVTSIIAIAAIFVAAFK